MHVAHQKHSSKGCILIGIADNSRGISNIRFIKSRIIIQEFEGFGNIDSSSEIFPVFANTSEFKVFECGENDAGWWRKAYSVGASLREFKLNVKVSEIG